MAHKIGILALIFLIGLLAACEQDEAVVVVTETGTAVSPTIPSPTSTPTPTLTPLPTFAPEELETAVADLLANPMNCDVPCWWGAIPGETTALEIEQSLAPYKFYDYWYEKTQQPNFIELWFDRNINEESIYFPIRYTFENHILKTIYTGKAPPLNEILGIYGQPDEIWVSVLGSHEEWFSPLWLNLIYFEEHMAVGYVENSTIANEKLTGCFSNTKMQSIRINSPSIEIEDENFTSIYFSESLHLPLREATNLTMEEFMQQFSDPTQPQCLETPTELWE